MTSLQFLKKTTENLNAILNNVRDEAIKAKKTDWALIKLTRKMTSSVNDIITHLEKEKNK